MSAPPSNGSTIDPITGLPLQRMLYDQAPRNVYWECTIACDLDCKHCRASAISEPHPDELTHEQGRALIDSIAELGSMLILTGGDPLKRPDLFELIAYARGKRVPVSITPSVTPLLTREMLTRLAEAGIAAVGVSIDGPSPQIHESVRGIDGTLDRTREVLRWCAELKLPVQVNTTITRFTAPHLPELYQLLSREATPPVRRWSLFVLVPVGRGTSLDALGGAELDKLFGWIWEQSRNAPFHMGTVEAPHYRRFVWDRIREAAAKEGGDPDKAVHQAAVRMGAGIRDGNGIVFVSHKGEVCPAGFLPMTVGRVQEETLTNLYRHNPLMQDLRHVDDFKGKCGRCEYRYGCGGSRARAFALTGDPLGSDPFCTYEPPA